MNLSITSPDNLKKLNDLLNKSWLDADNVIYDDDHDSVNLAFKVEDHNNAETTEKICLGLIKTLKIPVYKASLTVKEVDSFYIDDTETIGLYDVCEIKYIPSENKFSIITGINLDIDIFVKSFNLEFQMEDTPYKWIKRLLLFNGFVESFNAKEL